VLSVVLPIRVSTGGEFRIERLGALLAFFGRYDDVECVVVDSASPAPFGEQIRRLCDGRPRCRLVADPDPQEPFAPGAVRNAGAREARGEWLLFFDVDFSAGASFVPDVLAWTRAARDPRDFLVVPCLFLTRESTERLAFRGEPADLGPYRASLLAGDNDLVHHLATSPSPLVVRREHFLAIGGNRPEYRGHGYEDFDLLHRLASHRPIGKRPPDYLDDVKAQFVGDLRGFRAYFALYGLPHLFEGLHAAHLWHARPPEEPFFARREENAALFQRLAREHDAAGAWTDEGATPTSPLRDVINELMHRHGVDPAANPGLLRRKEGVAPRRGTPLSKLRKLLRSPRSFLADSRLPPLRALARLLG